MQQNRPFRGLPVPSTSTPTPTPKTFPRREKQKPRSRSKRQGGVSRGPHQENSSERTALRESGTGASLSGSLGSNVGGYAHPRNHETASGDHVRGRKTNPAPAAGGTVPLLPVRRTGGASGWLCRSRSRLLRSTAG